MLIRQLDAKVTEMWNLGFKWCVEHNESLDLRNYLLISLQMIFVKGLKTLKLTMKNQDQELFFDEIIEKLKDKKNEIMADVSE